MAALAHRHGGGFLQGANVGPTVSARPLVMALIALHASIRGLSASWWPVLSGSSVYPATRMASKGVAQGVAQGSAPKPLTICDVCSAPALRQRTSAGGCRCLPLGRLHATADERWLAADQSRGEAHTRAGDARPCTTPRASYCVCKAAGHRYNARHHYVSHPRPQRLQKGT